jgi:hypothetical protein
MKQWKMYFIIAVISGLFLSIISYKDDYTVEKDVPVTFIEKMQRDSCSKHSCRGQMYGLFKTEDGYFFDRRISMYMYTQMHVGEKFNMSLSRMDIKQTGWDNLIYFFGTTIFTSIFFVTLVASMICYFIGRNDE